MLGLIAVSFLVFVSATSFKSCDLTASFGLMDPLTDLRLSAFQTDVAQSIEPKSAIELLNALPELPFVAFPSDQPILSSHSLDTSYQDKAHICDYELRATEAEHMTQDKLHHELYQKIAPKIQLKPIENTSVHSLIRKRREYCRNKSFFNSCDQKFTAKKFTVLYPRSYRKIHPREEKKMQVMYLDEPAKGQMLPSFSQRFPEYK